jgi:hypothetical protein
VVVKVALEELVAGVGTSFVGGGWTADPDAAAEAA